MLTDIPEALRALRWTPTKGGNVMLLAPGCEAELCWSPKGEENLAISIRVASVPKRFTLTSETVERHGQSKRLSPVAVGMLAPAIEKLLNNLAV